MMEPRQRLILGRNYIESLLLTLTQLEFSIGATLEDRLEYILRLEEEICALSMGSRVVRNEYHKALKELLGEEFPDLPKPTFRTCFASKALREWIDTYSEKIFGSTIYLGDSSSIEKGKRELLARLLRTAIMAALYNTGIVSTSH